MCWAPGRLGCRAAAPNHHPWGQKICSLRSADQEPKTCFCRAAAPRAEGVSGPTRRAAGLGTAGVPAHIGHIQGPEALVLTRTLTPHTRTLARTHTHAHTCSQHMLTRAHNTCTYAHLYPHACTSTHMLVHRQPTKAAACIPAACPAQLAETRQCKSQPRAAARRRMWVMGPSRSQACGQRMKMSRSCLGSMPQGPTGTRVGF